MKAQFRITPYIVIYAHIDILFPAEERLFHAVVLKIGDNICGRVGLRKTYDRFLFFSMTFRTFSIPSITNIWASPRSYLGPYPFSCRNVLYSA